MVSVMCEKFDAFWEGKLKSGKGYFNIESTTPYLALPTAIYYLVDLPNAPYCPEFWNNLGKCVSCIFSQLTHWQNNNKTCLLHFKSIWFLLICGFTEQSGVEDMWRKLRFAKGEKY